MQSGRCLALSDIKLHLRMRLCNSETGKAIPGEAKTLLQGGYMLGALFSGVEIRVNSEPIFKTADYAIVSKYCLLVNCTAERRQVLAETLGFVGNDYYDVGGAREEAGGPMTFTHAEEIPKLPVRMGIWNDAPSGGIVTISSYLLTDLFSGEREMLLPPCSISITLTPADARKSLLTTAASPVKTCVEFVSAHITIPSYKPRPGLHPRALKWDFMRMRTSVIVAQKGVSEVHSPLQHDGRLPSRISLFLIRQENHDGSFRKAHLRSLPHNLNEVQVRMGARVIPSNRLKIDFSNGEDAELFLAVRDALKWSLAKMGSGHLLERDDWKANGCFILTLDATVDMRSGWGFRWPEESGSVTLSLGFSTPLGANVIIVALVENVARLSVEPAGKVSITV